MRYHTQTVFHFKANDGKVRYCKYRVIPFDDVPEEGILPPEDYIKILDVYGQRAPGDARPKDYLTQEFINRVRKQVD